eukprot:TRINITY_DN70835_c3_g1_i1.p1 TRINITY_DN70835_c3_g1~~TRINITY_DN70835_c3_g1_i1.p1  ORF type:complete len:1854 (-),score=220.87 TRINITY_DN70835_c3_g1_i1:676-6237(-)
MQSSYHEFRKKLDLSQPITIQQQNAVGPSSPINNCQEIVRMIRRVDKGFTKLWYNLYKVVFESERDAERKQTLMGYAKKAMDLWQDKERVVEAGPNSLANKELKNIETEVAKLHRGLPNNVQFLDPVTTTTLINKAIEASNDKGTRRYQDLVLEALGLDLDRSESTPQTQKRVTRTGTTTTIVKPKISMNRIKLAKSVPRHPTMQIRPFECLVLKDDIRVGKLFRDEILHPLSQYSTPKNSVILDNPVNYLKTHRKLKRVPSASNKLLSRFKRKEESAFPPVEFSMGSRRFSAPTVTTNEKSLSKNEAKLNEILGKCKLADHKARKDISRAISAKRVLKKELLKMQDQLKRDPKGISRKQIQREVKTFLSNKHLFIYGKGELGRFLDKNGKDLVKLRDQVAKIDLKYGFMREKLMKVISQQYIFSSTTSFPIHCNDNSLKSCATQSQIFDKPIFIKCRSSCCIGLTPEFTSPRHYFCKSRITSHKQIEDVEHEFANGYFFGELLHRLGLLADLSKLQNSNSSKATQQNYEVIKEPLKAIGCTYNPAQIQSKSPGAALKLLYTIKLKTEGTKAEIPAEKSPTKARKVQTITGKDLANKQLTQKLEKFQQAKTQLYQKAAESIALEKTMKAQTVQNRIQQHNQTLKDNQKFMKEWMQNGLKNWYKNQQRAKTRIEKQQRFEQAAVDKYKAAIEKRREEGAKEVKEGIEGFERNLQRLGIDIQEQVIDDNDDTGEEKKKKKQPFSIVAAMTKIREKKTLADFARKEKERRQRKTQVDQAKTQAEIERLYKESEMLNRLQKESMKNRSQCYQKWRDNQCKGLIDSLAKQSELERQSRTKAQMAAFLKAKEVENQEFAKKRKVDLQASRKKFIESERLNKQKRRALYSKVIHQTIITQLLDIANEAYKKQLASETKQINVKEWEQWMKAFVNGDDIVPGGVTAYVSQTKAGWSKQLTFSLDPELERLEILDYVHSLGLWDPDLLVKGAKEAEVECEELDPPLQICNEPKELETEESDIWKWYAKVEDKFKGTASIIEKETEEVKEVLSYVPVKIAINGKRFTPKRTIAKTLEEKYGIKVLKPNSEIKRIKKLIEEERKAKEEKKEEAKGKPATKATGKQEAAAKKEEPAPISPALKQIVEQIMQLPPNESETELNQLEVNFVIEWLKQSYPKSASEYRQELKARLKRKQAVEAELKIMQEEAQNKKGGKGNPKKEQELLTELQELNKPAEKGFVLVGFPKNLDQAKMLQEFLVPQKLSELGHETEDLKYAKTLSGTITSPNKVMWTSPSALDGVLLIDISKVECKDRGANRKKDMDKGEFWLDAFGEKPEGAKLVEAPVESEKLERIYWKSVAADSDLCKVEDYYERFQEKIAGELKAKIWHRIQGANTTEKIAEEIDSLVNTWMEIHSQKETKIVTEIEAELQQEEAKTEPVEAKAPEVEDKKDQEPTTEISKFNKEGILEAWSKVREKYVDSMNIIFKFYRKQKSMLISGLTEMHRQFLTFFERPDEKQRLLDEFLIKLNALLSDHPDYIENPSALKEIFQSIDDLDYKLWKVVEKKKDEATIEREEKMNSSIFYNIKNNKGWLKQEVTNSLTAAHDLMQYEINKFVDGSYFLASCPEFLEGRSLPPLFDEIILQFDSSLVGEEPYSLIEKLCNEAKKFVSDTRISSLFHPQNTTLLYRRQKQLSKRKSRLLSNDQKLPNIGALHQCTTQSNSAAQSLNGWTISQFLLLRTKIRSQRKLQVRQVLQNYTIDKVTKGSCKGEQSGQQHCHKSSIHGTILRQFVHSKATRRIHFQGKPNRNYSPIRTRRPFQLINQKCSQKYSPNHAEQAQSKLKILSTSSFGALQLYSFNIIRKRRS